MQHLEHYETVSVAVEALKNQGYTLEFYLNEKGLVVNDTTYNITDFEILDIYHYEGDTDPADEATVYAIASKTGVKGILVTGSKNNLSVHETNLLLKLKINTP